MLHTAHFYLDLTAEDLYLLEIHFGVPYEKIGEKVNVQGFTTWITKKYGTKLYFIVDFIKLLGRANIVESDFPEVEKRVLDYIDYLFVDQSYYDRIVLLRIDYRLDVKLPENYRKTILYLYKKVADKYRHQKKYDKYETSIYFNSMSVQGICYDKEEDVNAKGSKIEDYEVDILRFEVRLQNRHLKYMKYRKGKEKWLEEYFQEALYKKYLHQYLGILLFKGDYYKINKAKTIIDKSNLREKEKEQLLEFLKYISEKGYEKAKKQFTRYYRNKFLSQLENLQINPILIPKNRKDFPSYMKNPFTF